MPGSNGLPPRPPTRQPYPDSLNPFTASSSYSSTREPLLQDQDVPLDEALQRQKLEDLKKVDKNMGVVQDMYHQLHGEVVKQQDTIDAVDEQMEQAKDSTGKVVAGRCRGESFPTSALLPSLGVAVDSPGVGSGGAPGDASQQEEKFLAKSGMYIDTTTGSLKPFSCQRSGAPL